MQMLQRELGAGGAAAGPAALHAEAIVAHALSPADAPAVHTTAPATAPLTYAAGLGKSATAINCAAAHPGMPAACPPAWSPTCVRRRRSAATTTTTSAPA